VKSSVRLSRVGSVIVVITAIASAIGIIIQVFSIGLQGQGPFLPLSTATYAVIIITGTPIPTYTPFPTITPTKIKPTTSAANATPDIEVIQTEIAQLHLDIKNVQQQVDAFNQNQNSADIAKIKNQLTDIDSRLSSIEQVVLDNPSKALSTVLLNKDVESIKQRQDSDTKSMQDNIGRVYGLNLWFLGIMIPMAISVVGLAIRNFLSGRESEKDKTESKQNTSNTSSNDRQKFE